MHRSAKRTKIMARITGEDPVCRSRPRPTISPPERILVWYHLRLGTLGFGGPVALVGLMERELVGQRK
jgi:hypothetical protein